MNTALMFSSKSDEWETPQSLFDALDNEFCFLLDAAASHDNHKGEDGTAYITAAGDALSVDWLDWIKGKDGDPRSVNLQPTVWLNPPYSKCADFVAKAAAESRTGCTVVMLLPARTDTRYFHDYIWICRIYLIYRDDLRNICATNFSYYFTYRANLLKRIRMRSVYNMHDQVSARYFLQR